MTTWEVPKDQDEELEYPYYSLETSPSGHMIVKSDKPGCETLSYKHRSGSLFQFQADGSIVVIAKKNAYRVVFGDDNMLVTGAHNVTINGGGSLRVEGDYDMTVAGNMKTSIAGNHEVTVAGNQTSLVKGNQETVVGENSSTKVAGNQEILAKKTLLASESDLRVASGGEMSVLSDAGMTMEIADGIAVEAGDGISMDAGDAVSVQAGAGVAIDSASLEHNGTNVGDDHTHLGVMAGMDETDVPV